MSVKNSEREREISEEVKSLHPISFAGMSCAHCGTSLDENDLCLICSDCGGVFCKDCVETGEFHDHCADCEDY